MAGKVFMACALGGGVGALVALQMWQPFWWVGMLVGGLVGYLAYGFDEVCRAVSLAWRETIEWHSNPVDWSNWRKDFMSVFNFILNIAVGVCLSAIFIYAVWGTHSQSNNLLFIKFVGSFLFMGGCIGLFVAAFSASDSAWRAVGTCSPYPTSTNVFRFYFLIVPRAIVKGVWLAVTRGPGWIAKGVVVIARFLWQVFLLIHSEMLLLCGLDSAIGAAIGYWLGNAGIGALAGGVFGLINFEIVSKRWLKLIPAK